MTGMIGQKELTSALDVSDELKQQISKYERNTWAASIDAINAQHDWRQFLLKLETAVHKNKLNDSLLIELIHYLSTHDSMDLIRQIGNLNQDRQVRFLELLNWVSEKSSSAQQRKNAANVKERILMIYRMKEFPRIYSPARIARATNIVKSS